VGKYFLIFLSGLVICILLIILLKKISSRFNILITQKIPLVGGFCVGLAFGFASLLGFFLFQGDLRTLFSVVGVAFVMLVFGLADDFRELSVIQKFFLQFICALLLPLAGIRTHIVFFGFWGNLLITVVWILGVTNSFNLLDISDGLSASVALIAGVSFFAISFIHYQFDVQILALSLCAALFGFLVFNLPPAKIYLGNSGSHFLGFILAMLALMVDYAPVDRPVALLSPIIILWLPLLDTAFLIYFRLRKGLIPFHKSDDHIALRFVTFGFTTKKVLVLMSALALFFASCGIAVSKASNLMGIIVTIFVLSASFGVFVGLHKLKKNG